MKKLIKFGLSDGSHIDSFHGFDFVYGLYLSVIIIIWLPIDVIFILHSYVLLV